MAHPARRSTADQLVRGLELDPSRLVLDPYPDEPTGALPPFVLACAQADPDVSPWHVVLMDDAIPCDGFWRMLSTTLSEPPAGTVSLYHEWGSRTGAVARCAAVSGRRYAPVVDPYVPTIGIAMPATWSLEMAAAFPGRQTVFEDIALGRFLASRARTAFASVPTLVQHRTMPSLVGHDGRGERKSTLYASDSSRGALTGLSPSVWTGRYAPYVRYHDLVLHVLTSVDGRSWTKLGVEAWLHQHPDQRERLARLTRIVEPDLDGLLNDRDPAFDVCRCSQLSAQHLALMAMALIDAGDGVDGPDDVSAAALETLLPGTLRIGHDTPALRGLGDELLRLLRTALSLG